MTVVAQTQLLGSQSVIISFRVSSRSALKKEQIIFDHPGFQEQRQRVPSSGQYCYMTKVCCQSMTTAMHTLSWSYATGQFARHHGGKAVVAGNSGGDLPYLADSDSQRLLHTGSAKLDTFARFPRGLQPSCDSPPSVPQSSGAVEHSGRQNVAGSGRKSGDNDNKGLKNLRNHSQKLNGTSQSPPQASPSLLRSDFPAVDGANMPISLSPSGSVFIPTARIDVPFPECLRLGEGRVSISSMFRMALICCVVAQWIKIAGALSMWTSRLRLKFFDSPLIYKDATKSSKVGRVGVFWDLENCPVPSVCDVPTVIEKVRAIGNTFGDIQCFRAYGKLEYLTRQALPFLSKDVELCPVPDGKESADKAIILDASLFAFDHKPCLEDSEDSKIENDVVLVVTGDRGFAALLQELSKRNITTIVIGNGHQSLPSVLSQSADISLGWEDMMICDEFDNDLFDKYNKSQPNRDPSMKSVCCNVEEPDLDSGSESRKVELRDSSGVDCYQLDSNGSELFCTIASEKPPPLVYGLKKVVSYISTREVKQTDCNTYESADSSKSYIPIGGKIRVLRHLRQEIAAVADKYLNKGTRINLREFVKLYEVEMGHALIPGYYGCGSMKNLLESMPDLVSLRPFASDSSELEVFPFFAKGRSSYGKINYSREDLRCILYELLHTKWPNGVKKDSLSSEHLRITGRPFVLVTYEFLKTGDVFGSMRDIVYIDPRTKQLHLVNGAQEPAGYSALARNHWN